MCLAGETNRGHLVRPWKGSVTKNSSRLERCASGRAGGNLQQITELTRLARGILTHVYATCTSRSFSNVYRRSITLPELPSIAKTRCKYNSKRRNDSELGNYERESRGALTRPGQRESTPTHLSSNPDPTLLFDHAIIKTLPLCARKTLRKHVIFTLLCLPIGLLPCAREREHDTGWRLPPQ